jgi:Ca2+:H+ antiporter
VTREARLALPWWAWAAPAAAALLLGGTGGGLLATGGAVFLLLAPMVLVASVFGAVFHAETISRRLGPTLGAIVLALAVTAIEVSLIASLMLQAEAGSTTVARDTVFAGVMVVLNGVVGVALIAGSLRHREQHFQLQGTASGLGVLATLAVIAMILPDYTVAEPGPVFSTLQLVFVSGASLSLYGIYLYVQATSQRSYFTSIEPEELAAPGTVPAWVLLRAVGLLIATLLAVVLLADALSPEVTRLVRAVGLPLEFVAVVIAVVVLLPEGTSSVRAAQDDRLQTSLNFALGSAISSTGLTIPAISLLSVVLDAPIELGLEPEHMVLLTLSLFISALNLSTGRTTVLQGAIHLVIFVVFLLIAAVP